MTDRREAARAALEAALAATSPGVRPSAKPTAGPSAGPTASPTGSLTARGDVGGDGRISRPARPGRTEGGEDAEGGGRGRRGGGRRGGGPGRADRGDPEASLQERGSEPDPREVARQIVLRQLAMAPRSRQQLRDKLRQRNCPDDVAESVLDRMTEVGLVDDEAYAAMLVRSKQAGPGLATRALARELRTKGIDEETAQATLAEIDPEDERDRARVLVEKKLRTMHGLDATVQTRRLAGMLARKGYPSSVVFSVIREAIADAPEHQRD